MVVARVSRALLILGITLACATAASAGGECCARCGLMSDCRLVCRLVRTYERVDGVRWDWQPNPLCLPGPSRRGCPHGAPPCAACRTEHDQLPLSLRLRTDSWPHLFPTPAKMYAKKKLMRKMDSLVVPKYQWVVETVCPACVQAVQPAAETESAAVMPVVATGLAPF